MKKRGEIRTLCYTMAILEIQDLTAGYGNGDIIKNISFSLNKGVFLSVLGRNGSGKSTMIKDIQGFLMEISGKILIDGKDMSSHKPRELAQKMAYVPQLFEVSFEFTVEEITDPAECVTQGNRGRQQICEMPAVNLSFAKEKQRSTDHAE